MANGRPGDYTIEAGPMGPIGEGEALILRVNRNCPWNKCLFCPVYKGKKYGARSFQEIKEDIDAIRRIWVLLKTKSREMGLGGFIGREVVQKAVMDQPEIYGRYPNAVTREQRGALRSLNNVVNWVMHGGKRVFLQDANALALKPSVLIRVFRYLKEIFPNVSAVTCYARSKTCERRSFEELKTLSEAGLSWCFLGIESGCDEVLDYMRKGVHMEEHIHGGQKLMAAGINTAAFVMPGLSGDDQEMSRRHITDTIKVLNEIRPNEVRVRSLAVLEESVLYERWESGEFITATEDIMVKEIKMLIEGLSFDCTFETLQMTNPLFTLKDLLSETRSAMLDRIQWYEDLPLDEKARFMLGRYVNGGYLDFVKTWGKYDSRLKQLVADAESGLREGSEEVIKRVERAVFAIKSKGVP